MAEIPGQIEHLTDERRLTTPVWYEWFLFVYRSIFGSWKTLSSTTMTASAGGPPIGTVDCRYRQIGRTVDVSYNIKITNANGASGILFVTLPKSPPVAYAMLVGEETDVSGPMVFGRITPGDPKVLILFYNTTTVIIANARIILSGTYEV